MTMHMRDIINTVLRLDESDQKPIHTSMSDLESWGESIGVWANVTEDRHDISLHEISRDKSSQKGAGAMFIRALCAYADKARKPIYASVVSAPLEDYYKQFGFQSDESTRDAETGDVIIVRQPQGR